MGNPGQDSAAESGGSEGEQQELDFWWLREIYIQAIASGITDEQYSRLTLTKIVAYIEAEKHRRYWHARPIVTAMLPHLDKKSLRSIAQGGKGRGDETTARAVAKMLEEYAPASAHGSQRSRRPQVVPDLPWEAAQGVVLAFERGLIDGPAWASISQWYPRIAETAKRGRRGENR